MLLWANNHSWTHEAHVCNNLVGSEAVTEDEVCADQTSSAAKASFAMDCDSLLSDGDYFMGEVDEFSNEA
jgi:hypothetical protein